MRFTDDAGFFCCTILTVKKKKKQTMVILPDCYRPTVFTPTVCRPKLWPPDQRRAIVPFVRSKEAWGSRLLNWDYILLLVYSLLIWNNKKERPTGKI